MNFRKSSILVTGGAGMIGSNLVGALVKAGHSVKVIDNLWRGHLSYLMDEDGSAFIDLDNDFYNIDLAIPGACDHVFADIDYVVHLADVVAGINYVFANQGEIFRQNLLINSNVINAASRSKIKGFVYVGTACSFPAYLQNSLDYKLLREADLYPAEPESAYGWSKLMGNYETELLGRETDIKVTNLIVHNVYGAPCDFSPERSQVIPALMRKILETDNNIIKVWGSGEQGRAFVHVDDVVAAIMLTLDKGMAKGDIQIGPEICTSIRDVAENIVKISGKDIEILYDRSKPEGDIARAADFGKAKAILGWQPHITLEQGMTMLYRWIAKEKQKNE